MELTMTISNADLSVIEPIKDVLKKCRQNLLSRLTSFIPQNQL